MGLHFGDYGSQPLQRTDRARMPACPFIPHDPCIISSSTWTLRTSWPNPIYSSLVEGAIPAEGLSAKYSGCFKFTPCCREKSHVSIRVYKITNGAKANVVESSPVTMTSSYYEMNGI